MKALLNHRSVIGLLLLLLVLVGCQRSPQARRDRFIASGKKLMEQKDFARATIQFRNAVLAMPKDAEAYYHLGLAYLGAGDIRRGYGTLQKAVELNPSHSQAQLKIAQLQSATGDPDMMKDATKRLESLLSSSGSDAETLNTLAFTEIRLGNLPAATQHLEELLAGSPRQLVSSVLLANAKLAQGDAKGAEEVLKAACANDPKSADASVMLGKFYVSLNRRTEAEQQFQRALQLDPHSASALSSLGLIQYASGRRQEAEQSFKRLAGFSDSNANYIYGLFLFQESRPLEAVPEFERLSKIAPENQAARTRLVAAYLRAGRAIDAESVLAKALQKNPKDTSALLQRGEIHLNDKKYSAAEEDFNRVVKLRPDAPEIHYLLAKLNQARGSTLIYRQELTETLRLNPGLLAVRLELAQNLLQANAAKSALEVLDETPGRQKETGPVRVALNWAMWALGDMAGMRKGIDQGLAKERSGDLLVQDGLWKLRAGNPSGARESLDEALKINPSDLRALQALRDTYLAQKNPSMALQAVKEFAARSPQSAPVQDFLGMLLLAEGDREAARTAILSAKQADPRFEQADLLLVQLDVADGHLDSAEKRLSELLARSQENTRAQLWLGNVQEMRGEHSAAIEQYRKVVQNDPNSAPALNNLAYLLLEHGKQPDEALRYAQKAVELSPTRPIYADTLGWALYQRGLYSSAVKYLELAGPGCPDVVCKYHLAMAYAKSGDSKRGRTTLDAALKLNAKLPEAQMAQAVVNASH